ncbi:hypothetical protein KFK09_007154 [Dendrobium nobile]|uniref:Uncharacterized protein n=1 Tax=Dendrobium nobile TaxID=94219 RepID=A0A8T3BVK0_DENNO|nr:hypothetical protein KFK09_007154 [Dendrobium nobile]
MPSSLYVSHRIGGEGYFKGTLGFKEVCPPTTIPTFLLCLIFILFLLYSVVFCLTFSHFFYVLILNACKMRKTQKTNDSTGVQKGYVLFLIAFSFLHTTIFLYMNVL